MKVPYVPSLIKRSFIPAVTQGESGQRLDPKNKTTYAF